MSHGLRSSKSAVAVSGTVLQYCGQFRQGRGKMRQGETYHMHAGKYQVLSKSDEASQMTSQVK